jgi:chorismate mutase-like protein
MSPESEIEQLRAQLERIDDALLDSLRERIACCVRIAEVKQRGAVPMMQPHRIRRVHDRAASYAADNGLDAGFLHRLYEVIIEETCRVETLVMAEARS